MFTRPISQVCTYFYTYNTYEYLLSYYPKNPLIIYLIYVITSIFLEIRLYFYFEE